MNGAGRPRPQGGIDLLAWIFMRVSGVVLLFMVLVHLAIMHIINNIEVINYHFVAQRYATPFWRTYDVVMLWLALIHGLNGMRVMIDDYVGSRGWRVFSLASLYVLGFMFLVLGSLVILTFNPARPF
ncbi:MAG TPA: succinate dehydrogenase hydrophobic membrane anchor subunit [Terriglobia bacterium]|nr:succinate dehydrogenase hydrophobic membrane anchor subunit [Terriglobia bacterium]